MDDLKNVGESNYNPGDGTDQRVQSLVFMMMIFITNLEVNERFFLCSFQQLQNIETDGPGDRLQSSTVTTSPITNHHIPEAGRQMDRHVPMPLFKEMTCLDLVQVVNSDDSCLLPLHFPNKACWKASSDWHIALAVNVCSLSRHKRYTTLNSQQSNSSSLCKLPGNIQRNFRLIKFLQPPGPYSFSGPNVHLTTPSSSISCSSRPEHTPALQPSVFRSF